MPDSNIGHPGTLAARGYATGSWHVATNNESPPLERCSANAHEGGVTRPPLLKVKTIDK
jgi:hypothetical protein